MNRDRPPIERAASTQIPALSFKDQVNGLLVKSGWQGTDWLLYTTVDHDQRGVDQPRMDGIGVGADPKKIGKRQVLKAGNLGQGASDEQGNFLPPAKEGGEKFVSLSVALGYVSSSARWDGGRRRGQAPT
jgi:hypothetical protein